MRAGIIAESPYFDRICRVGDVYDGEGVVYVAYNIRVAAGDGDAVCAIKSDCRI